MEWEAYMKLHLENLAKIKNADIEINGITVIAGENNTGKSTIGKVLYCLFECFFDIDKKIKMEKLNALRRNLIRWIDFDFSIRINITFYKDILQISDDVYKDKDALAEELKMIFEHYKEYLKINDFEQVLEYTYSLLNMGIDKVKDSLINKYMNMEFNNQVKSVCVEENPHVSLEIKDEKIELSYLEKFYITSSINLHNHLVYIENPQIIDNMNWRNSTLRSIGMEYRAIDSHEGALLKMMLDRKSENLFDEELNKEKLNKILYKVNETVNGEFVIKDGVLDFKEKHLHEPLHLSNLSTGLKSFVIMKKLIEDGFIEQNGFLILDEPEVHLHPKWQLIYAELLVILQKEMNLNIVLTSHSPYFINAIEVFSAKHKIANTCRYYLSVFDDAQIVFEDVTMNIDKIYERLASPLQELEDIMNQL